MRTFHLALLLIAITFLSITSCRPQKKIPAKTPDVRGYAGIYIGNLPCADCEKIEYKLQLNTDLTYYARFVYSGKSDVPFEERGPYTIADDGMVVLEKKDNGMKYFRKHPSGLLMLDTKGREITGALSGSYILTVVPIRTSGLQQDPGDPVSQKWAEGVDFYASGNEPSWMLEIDFEKSFTFNTLNGLNIIVPPSAGTEIKEANTLLFESLTESAELIITLTDTKCSDNMSGTTFAYRVKVQCKNSGEPEYQIYEGCGYYLADSRLEKKWNITEVEGNSLNPDDFIKGNPGLEFSIREGRVFGNDGCNSIFGRFTPRGSQLTIGMLANTLIACPNMAMSDRIKKVLSEETFAYTIQDNQLILESEGKVRMKLTEK